MWRPENIYSKKRLAKDIENLPARDSDRKRANPEPNERVSKRLAKSDDVEYISLPATKPKKKLKKTYHRKVLTYRRSKAQ